VGVEPTGDIASAPAGLKTTRSLQIRYENSLL